MANDKVRNKAKAQMTNEFVFRRYFATGHFSFVIHFSPFSKFWRRSDAVPSLQSRGFELAVLAAAQLERSCEENAWSPVLLSGTSRCFSKTLFSTPHRRLQRNLLPHLSLHPQA